MTCFMVSTGHGEPAMMPVRSEVRSSSSTRGSASIAMNMVGTPYNEVQRSVATDRRVAAGSNPGAGMTIVAPCVVQARLPMTMPKQW